MLSLGLICSWQLPDDQLSVASGHSLFSARVFLDVEYFEYSA